MDAYNPALREWSVVFSNSNLPLAGAEVWTGTSLLYFGGQGCLVANSFMGQCPLAESFDPATPEVLGTFSTQGAPAYRFGASTVWSGSKMIVWGGQGIEPDPAGGYDTVTYNDGGIYDPASESWTSIGASAAPEPRWAHSAVWTGSQMIVWGGALLVAGGAPIPQAGTIPDASAAPPIRPADAGTAYDPSSDTWSALPTAGQPAPRGAHVAVWTGTEMIVWGGATIKKDPVEGFPSTDLSPPLADGAAYNPTTLNWRPIAPAPSGGLTQAVAVWTGSEMLVWGGFDESGFSNHGYRYNPSTDTWQYITTIGAPEPRIAMGAVWTGQSLIVWGGNGDGYNESNGAEWSPTPGAGSDAAVEPVDAPTDGGGYEEMQP